jgi:twitching motility protein PilI
MATQDALRELQARLASQLEAAQSAPQGRSWLAVECRGAGLLLPLSEAGEIFPFRTCVAVPHTRAWFLGVAHLRGQLHGVVDLARFLGLDLARGAAAPGWLVALNPTLDTQAALRVDRLAGLRREAQLRRVEPTAAAATTAAAPGADTPRPAFAGACYQDGGAGRVWQEISLAALGVAPHFLNIAAGE